MMELTQKQAGVGEVLREGNALVKELPILLELSTKLYANIVTEFILLRKMFVGKVTKELLSLMDVS